MPFIVSFNTSLVHLRRQHLLVCYNENVTDFQTLQVDEQSLKKGICPCVNHELNVTKHNVGISDFYFKC